MKKFTLSTFVILAAAGLGIVLSGSLSADPQTPREIAHGLVNALTHHDEQAITHMFCDPALAALVFPPTEANPNFAALTYQENPAGDGSVSVTVTGTIQSFDGTTNRPFSWTLHMQKSGSQWCVASLEAGRP